MNDEQIRRFIRPSVDYLADITGRDWLSTVLYLNGESMTENFSKIDGVEQALMIAPEMVEEVPEVTTKTFTGVLEYVQAN